MILARVREESMESGAAVKEHSRARKEVEHREELLPWELEMPPLAIMEAATRYAPVFNRQCRE